MDIGPTELLIILVIVVILFGSGRIAKLGGELGHGLREFRKGLAGEDDAPAKTSTSPANSTADSTAPTDTAAK
jgi:sec-independent protein translocase protein TatA